jgi:hypothetical protein
MTLPPYTSNPKHRNSSPGESQWTISEAQELACFVASYGYGWVDIHAGNGWGLHVTGTRPDVLGVVEDHTSPSYIAKFIGNAALWHGYPADHTRRTQDIPPGRILSDWRNRGYVTKAKMGKLSTGKRCSL